jgi:predicted Zn-dependent protease
MIWTREQAKALTDRALSFSKAEEAQAILNGGDRSNVRFARNSVTTAGASSGYSLALVANFGKKSGTVTTSEFSDASLQQAMRKAEEIAKLSPDNPEAMPVLGSQAYVPVKAFFEDAASAPPEWRADSVRAAIDLSKQKDVVSAGYVETSGQMLAVATSPRTRGKPTRDAASSRRRAAAPASASRSLARKSACTPIRRTRPLRWCRSMVRDCR